MNNVNKLIKKIYSEEVDYKPLWSVTIWDKKFNGVDKKKQNKVISYYYYLASEFEKIEREKGNIAYISTGITDKERYTTSELAKGHISEGEIVCIPWGGTPNVKYFNGKFVTGDNRIATSIDTNILSNKFLYYWLQSKLSIISTFYRGSGIKHPDMKKVLELRIPVPPIEVQNEIVRILDNFTELEAELKAELEARKKQYEYYRDKLLKETNGNKTELHEFLKIKNGCDYKKLNVGKYPVYGTGGIMTYVDEYVYDKPSVLIPRKGSLDKLYYVEVPFWNVDTIFYTEIDEKKANPKYIYYCLENEHLEQYNHAGGIPSLTQKVLNRVKIPLPELEEQQKIVSILDRFDKLCNDISQGLPAEIEARRKQYEYYRDKLLNFKELKVENKE